MSNAASRDAPPGNYVSHHASRGLGPSPIHFRGERLECGGWSGPAQLVDVVEDRDIGAQRREIAEQERPVAFAAERGRQRAGVGGVDAPGSRILGNRFEVADSAPAPPPTTSRPSRAARDSRPRHRRRARGSRESTPAPRRTSRPHPPRP